MGLPSRRERFLAWLLLIFLRSASAQDAIIIPTVDGLILTIDPWTGVLRGTCESVNGPLVHSSTFAPTGDAAQRGPHDGAASEHHVLPGLDGTLWTWFDGELSSPWPLTAPELAQAAAPVALGPDAILLGERASSFMAIDAATGRALWATGPGEQLPGGGQGAGMGNGGEPPLLLLRNDFRVTALDTTSGATRFNLSVGLISGFNRAPAAPTAFDRSAAIGAPALTTAATAAALDDGGDVGDSDDAGDGDGDGDGDVYGDGAPLFPRLQLVGERGLEASTAAGRRLWSVELPAATATVLGASRGQWLLAPLEPPLAAAPSAPVDGGGVGGSAGAAATALAPAPAYQIVSWARPGGVWGGGEPERDRIFVSPASLSHRLAASAAHGSGGAGSGVAAVAAASAAAAAADEASSLVRAEAQSSLCDPAQCALRAAEGRATSLECHE